MTLQEAAEKKYPKIKIEQCGGKRLLYVMPHCSTGGLPQYTLKQIETFQRWYRISVVEVSFHGHDFVIQRDKIKAICDFHSLFGKEDKLPALVARLDPDILHFQELPEQFLSTQTCQKLFDESRKYVIISTTHGSLTKPEAIVFTPDQFVLVSEWSRIRFQKQFPKIPCNVWEYPIERKFVNKGQARAALQWTSKKLDVLNVGIFTPGKNQAEIFELARTMPDVNFHFVGNLADNFRHYWGPLMANRPENCFVYGGRPDVDTFYQAADLFYFSSLMELNPICIREALGYRLPVIMRKLEVYMNQYDRNPLVTYIRDSKDAYKLLNKIK